MQPPPSTMDQPTFLTGIFGIMLTGTESSSQSLVVHVPPQIQAVIRSAKSTDSSNVKQDHNGQLTLTVPGSENMAIRAENMAIRAENLPLQSPNRIVPTPGRHTTPTSVPAFEVKAMLDVLKNQFKCNPVSGTLNLAAEAAADATTNCTGIHTVVDPNKEPMFDRFFCHSETKLPHQCKPHLRPRRHSYSKHFYYNRVGPSYRFAIS
jgi:hypothetical protein